jgi:hypothetical protein
LSLHGNHILKIPNNENIFIYYRTPCGGIFPRPRPELMIGIKQTREIGYVNIHMSMTCINSYKALVGVVFFDVV